MTYKIVAVDRATDEKTVIEDMYWFEENYIHGMDDPECPYRFEIQIGILSIRIPAREVHVCSCGKSHDDVYGVGD